MLPTASMVNERLVEFIQPKLARRANHVLCRSHVCFGSEAYVLDEKLASSVSAALQRRGRGLDGQNDAVARDHFAPGRAIGHGANPGIVPHDDLLSDATVTKPDQQRQLVRTRPPEPRRSR